MNKYILLFLLPISSWASSIPPAPFPVFLKAGFSSILEFEEAPSRVVLGDSQNFQVERLEKSLVVKTLSSYAASNMFVYFKEQEPRLFVLTASEDAEPTYYKKFEEIRMPPPPKKELVSNGFTPKQNSKVSRILQASFDVKKDYLTIESLIAADSRTAVRPNWNLVRLTYNGKAIAPFKLWAERKDVQKDATVKARFIFAKPNLSRDLSGVALVIPLLGEVRSISLLLKGSR